MMAGVSSGGGACTYRLAATQKEILPQQKPELQEETTHGRRTGQDRAEQRACAPQQQQQLFCQSAAS